MIKRLKNIELIILRKVTIIIELSIHFKMTMLCCCLRSLYREIIII